MKSKFFIYTAKHSLNNIVLTVVVLTLNMFSTFFYNTTLLLKAHNKKGKLAC